MPPLFAEAFSPPTPVEEAARFAGVVALAGLAVVLWWLLVFAVRRRSGRCARLSSGFWLVAGCSAALLAFYLVAK